MERKGMGPRVWSHASLGQVVGACTLLLLAAGTGHGQVATVSARLRWLPSASPGVAGYRVYQRTLSGSYGVPYEAGMPQPGADGTLSYIVQGLEASVTYLFAVSVYTASGDESALSNEVVLYATATTTTSTSQPPSTTTTTQSSTTTTTQSSTTTTLAGGAISQAGWRLVYVDSQELVAENGAAVNAFDGDPATIWHSKWAPVADPLPHEIQIDLGGMYTVSGFRYRPRPSGQNGRIKDWEFYLATTAGSWGAPVATGSFTNSSGEKQVGFAARTARYLRLRALSEVNGNPWTSMAEINVLSTAAGSTTSSTTTSTTTTSTTTTSTTLAAGGLKAPPDWTSAFRAVFRLDEASGVRRNVPATGCGSLCDLDDIGGVGRYTADNPEGLGAAELVRSTPTHLAKWLSDLRGFNVSGSVAIGCWARPTFSGADGFLIARENGANAGYRLFRTAQDRYGFVIGDGTDRVFCVRGAAGQFATSQWQHVVGIFDDEGTLGSGPDRMYVFADGTQVGTACTQQALATTSWTFRLGYNTQGLSWGGQLDECFVRAGTLTAAEVCRIKSCGIDGASCLCSGAAYAPCSTNAQCGPRGVCDRTSNTCRGRNGGTCVLPACDAPAPPSGVARAVGGARDGGGDLAEAVLKVRAATGRRRVRVRGSFAAVAECDPAASGARAQVTTENGTLLYDAELAASAFRSRSARIGSVTWIGRTAVGSGAVGLQRVGLRIEGRQVRFVVEGLAPEWNWEALVGLHLRIRFGDGCEGTADLGCVVRQRVTSCRKR